MSDIGLFYRGEQGAFDARVSANDLALDDGLETAVALSLFTDRRVDGVRGWWGDAVPDVDGDQTGSRLWTLAREKDTPTVLRLAAEYAREALAWLVEDAVAESVDASAVSLRGAAGQSVMLLTAIVRRPGAGSASYRYQYNWTSQETRRA